MEKVVLLNDLNQPVGAADKALVHNSKTPFHLAFSLFLFNSKGEFLVQQRAFEKITWPGVWSNSCCGHPMPGETMQDAIYRRLNFELGFVREDVDIFEAIADFKYRAEFNGIVENEFCPVWIGLTDKLPNSNPDEVNDTMYIDWDEFVGCLKDENCEKFDDYSEWCKEEALLLSELPLFQQWISKIY